MKDRQPYAKPWKSFDDQVVLLQARGLHDAGDWKHELETIGYYRLSGYWYIFRRPLGQRGQREDRFFADASMADVVSLYRFDERLRLAVWEAITQIELALRVQIGYELGKLDRFVHLNPALLDPRVHPDAYAKLTRNLNELQARSREDFVTHLNTKYDGRLPIWVVTEILQLGQLIRLYEFAPYKSRVAIAQRVGARADEYQSWLKSLNIVRNIAAHHGRLWNRSISVKPKMRFRPTGDTLEHAVWSVDRLYGVLAVVAYLLRQLEVLGPIHPLKDALLALPKVHGVVPSAMGLPPHWEKQSLWVGTAS